VASTASQLRVSPNPIVPSSIVNLTTPNFRNLLENPMRYALTACVAAAALSCLPLKAAQAEPILYTETTTASGTLGGKSFKDRPLIVHYLGDTANVASPVPTLIQDTGGVASFYISDVGAGAFTGGQAVALLFKPSNGFAIGANSTNPNLLPGVNGAGGNAQGVILGTSNPALAGYGMTTPIGPLMGIGVKLAAHGIADIRAVVCVWNGRGGDACW